MSTETAPRFAVAFTIENDKPVNRPMWAHRLEQGRDRAMVTDQPERASTFAKQETAERWAEALSGTVGDRVVYKYEAVEAPVVEQDVTA